ncbi:hypothetical protein SAMN05421504_11080 [Amycolatopsis xylanica]|uniref:Uncharacterized protein n=1 Tax=Amycolatopsis xylanica TaxID=589385 RepID=A0A1H3QUK9_9PSEU|nr:hypothetical protein [Amycolatopsis xylanica]SDZ16761.1 hypothetical protein SAMN05421504_11080 [Amycolatopsis xylanica]
MTDADTEAALTVAARWLDDVPGVIGVGQGEADGAPTIDVFTGGGKVGTLPREVHGIPVRVREGGPFDIQAE